MNHLSEQDLVDAFYRESAPPLGAHLEECPECRARFAELKAELDALRECRVPEPPPGYETEVWNRLAPALETPPLRSFRFWWLASAVAALLVVAFVAGIWTEHNRAATRERTRERILLMATSDHLDRSQILLTELLHANPATFDAAGERERARDLVEENRLLRQSALQLGDRPPAAVLDDLERVLVSLANAPAHAPEETKMLQEHVDRDQLLWKVRVAGSNARDKGQKL